MRQAAVLLVLLALLLSSASAAPAKHRAASSPWFGMTRGIVALYSGPSMKASMLNVYRKGTFVLVDSTSHSFAHVIFSRSNQGWMPLRAIRRMTKAQVQAYVQHFVKVHPDVVKGDVK